MVMIGCRYNSTYSKPEPLSLVGHIYSSTSKIEGLEREKPLPLH